MQRTPFPVKITHLIPPGNALILVIAWNATDLRLIASEGKATTVLRGEISTA
jgi:hypothetical protein